MVNPREIYNTRRWRQLRQDKLAEADYCCERCFQGWDLQVHHRQTIKSRPDLAFEQENLEVVCRSCHESIHNSNYQEKESWKNLVMFLADQSSTKLERDEL